MGEPFAISTISDHEAAERLGFPLRVIRAGHQAKGNKA